MTEITQADRDEAADYYDLMHIKGDMRGTNMRLGNMDDLPLVQAFARHRIAALSAPREHSEAMIEAGVAVLRRFDPNSDMLGLVVDEIYRAMTAAKETQLHEREPVAWLHPDWPNYRSDLSPVTVYRIAGWIPLYREMKETE